MKKFLILAIILALPACSSTPRAFTSNVEGISFIFDGSKSELKEVTRQATNECQRFGRVAVLRNTSEVDDNYVANFSCTHGS